MKTTFILALALSLNVGLSAEGLVHAEKQTRLLTDYPAAPSNHPEADDPELRVKLRRHVIVSKTLPIDNVETIILSRTLRSGKLQISYQTAAADSGINRSFIFEDAAGKEIYRSEGSTVKLKVSRLRKMLASGTVRVVTLAIPSDPAKAAIVRVRPIHIINLIRK